jgi:hypothetical protein
MTGRYAHESRGTLRLRKTALAMARTTENYRPALSDERAPHINKPVSV